MFNTLLSNMADLISGFRLRDLLDIVIVAFCVYKIIQFIQKTRARQLVQGILILVIALGLSEVLDLYTISFALNGLMRYGLMAVIVIFYPELRRALESLGRRKIFFIRSLNDVEKSEVKILSEQIREAVEYMSASKTGALIVIERSMALTEIVENGTRIDADITSNLIQTIFYKGSTLHDGALIVRENRLIAAGCVLPLSNNMNLESTLGTRHRAALGVTEISDAVALIVSEETGIISWAADGKISRYLDTKTVEKNLYAIYMSDSEEKKDPGFSDTIRRLIGRNRDSQQK